MSPVEGSPAKPEDYPHFMSMYVWLLVFRGEIRAQESTTRQRWGCGLVHSRNDARSVSNVPRSQQVICIELSWPNTWSIAAPMIKPWRAVRKVVSLSGKPAFNHNRVLRWSVIISSNLQLPTAPHWSTFLPPVSSLVDITTVSSSRPTFDMARWTALKTWDACQRVC